VGEEVSGPSNETEAETLERRKVEALERLVVILSDHCATMEERMFEVVANLEHMASVVCVNEPEGFKPANYLRTDVITGD
jgi:hypothetical protein